VDFKIKKKKKLFGETKCSFFYFSLEINKAIVNNFGGSYILN
jgi:hypothetical protein